MNTDINSGVCCWNSVYRRGLNEGEQTLAMTNPTHSDLNTFSQIAPKNVHPRDYSLILTWITSLSVIESDIDSVSLAILFHFEGT